MGIPSLTPQRPMIFRRELYAQCFLLYSVKKGQVGYPHEDHLPPAWHPGRVLAPGLCNAAWTGRRIPPVSERQPRHLLLLYRPRLPPGHGEDQDRAMRGSELVQWGRELLLNRVLEVGATFSLMINDVSLYRFFKLDKRCFCHILHV